VQNFTGLFHSPQACQLPNVGSAAVLWQPGFVSASGCKLRLVVWQSTECGTAAHDQIVNGAGGLLASQQP
jgi:hypothetical protein